MVSTVKKQMLGQAKGRTARWLAVILFAGSIAPLTAARVHAELVVIGFTGVVIGVDAAFCQCIPPGTIEAGDSLVGFYTFDTTAPDVNPNPRIGRYVYKTTPHRFVVYHEDYTFASDPVDPFLAISVEDSMTNPAGRDTYQAFSWNNGDDPFQPFQENHLLALNLADDSGNALHNDSLVVPDLDDWPIRWISIYGAGFGYQISATVTSIGFGPPAGVTPRTRQGLYLSNHPNPFNPATTIQFGVPVSGQVAVEIYDVAGRRVRSLLEGVQDAGREHVVQWDGRDTTGRELPSGVYFGVLRTESGIATRKLVLLR